MSVDRDEAALREALRTLLVAALHDPKWSPQWTAAVEDARAALAEPARAAEQLQRERDEALKDVRDMSTGAWGSSAAMIVAFKHRAEAAEQRAEQHAEALEVIAGLSSLVSPMSEGSVQWAPSIARASLARREARDE